MAIADGRANSWQDPAGRHNRGKRCFAKPTDQTPGKKTEGEPKGTALNRAVCRVLRRSGRPMSQKRPPTTPERRRTKCRWAHTGRPRYSNPWRELCGSRPFWQSQKRGPDGRKNFQIRVDARTDESGLSEKSTEFIPARGAGDQGGGGTGKGLAT